jgi:hypothetical protein
MLIALDWDETYTCDPAFWQRFISLALNHEHDVVIVSARFRDDIEEIRDEVDHLPVGVRATGLLPKRAYMESKGEHVDVWVDDWPEWICGCASG